MIYRKNINIYIYINIDKETMPQLYTFDVVRLAGKLDPQCLLHFMGLPMSGT